MDSFVEIALNVLKIFAVTPEQLIHSLLKSDTTITYNDIEFSVQGHVNIHLLAKTKKMDTPVSIFWISDH